MKPTRCWLFAFMAVGCRPNALYCGGGSCNSVTDSARSDTSDGANDAHGGSGSGSEDSAQAGYQPTAVSFQIQNGSYLSMGPLSNVTNLSHQKGTFSVWLRFTAGDGQPQQIAVATIGSANPLLAGITRTGSNQIELNLPDCGNFKKLDVTTSYGPGFATSSGWNHILAAWDLTVPQASIYVNDQPVELAPNPTMVQDGIVCYEALNWGIGGLDNIFGGAQLDADVADLYSGLGTYLDISNQAVRSLFIDGNGKPVDLGANCTKPTEAEPIGCFNASRAMWNLNQGDGGGMNLNGQANPLPAASSP